jgi:hypothetical protein
VEIASLTVAPEHFLAGFRPDGGSVFLPVFSDARLGEPVAVRVGISGHPLRATLFGTVALVRRVGRPSLPPGAEIALDGASLRTAALLEAAARGEQVMFRDRPPRFLAALPLVAQRDALLIPATTTNVSSTGCAVAWTAAQPRPGEQLVLKLGEGLFAPAPRAIVAWSHPLAPGQARVGLRIVGGGRGVRAWEKLAAEAARTGAPEL